MVDLNRTQVMDFGDPTARLDIRIRQNAKFTLPLAIIQTYTPSGGNPYTLMNLTGWFIWMRVRSDYNTAVLMDGHTSNGRITRGTFGSNPLQYNVLVEFGSADIPSTDFGEGVYDILFRDTFGNDYVWVEGKATWVPGVTR